MANSLVIGDPRHPQTPYSPARAGREREGVYPGAAWAIERKRGDANHSSRHGDKCSSLNAVAERRAHRRRPISDHPRKKGTKALTEASRGSDSLPAPKGKQQEDTLRFPKTRICGSRSKLARYFIALVLMASIPGIDPSELSDTICDYLQYRDQCMLALEAQEAVLDKNGTYCPGDFDGYMCWHYGIPGQPAIASCPTFLHEANNTGQGFRFCQPNGSWFRVMDEITGEPVIWRHIDACTSFDIGNETSEAFDESESTLLTNFRIMYSIGYGVSLVCLVIALLLLAFFKKLHCTRNYIHMNLMVSFIIRYVVILVKDSVLVAHYRLDGLADFASNPDFDKLQQYCDSFGHTGWVLTRCRLVVTLMHYAITANYFWLLAEGLYLQMLLVFVMSENKYFAGFMVFGWGAPWISVLIWVVLRLKYENKGCWDMNDKLHVWWTIRAPIIISIVINFLIFVNIVRLIVSKLKANNMAHTDIKLRLAKSTLALIPLLGIHYIVFLALTEEITDNTTPMHLKLAFDMFLTSIQGTLVSVLYCFLNGEVRQEVRKAWRDWRNRKDLPRGGPNNRKSSTIHSGNQSTSVTYFSRHSTAGPDSLMPDGNSPYATRFDSAKKSNSIVRDRDSLHLSESGLGEGMNGYPRIENGKKKMQTITYEQSNGNGKLDNDVTHMTTTLVGSRDDHVEANGNVDCHECVPCLQEQSV